MLERTWWAVYSTGCISFPPAYESRNGLVRKMFDDKTLLITGGTGSFGNAVLRRFLDTGVREIRIFSRDEKKQEDMRIRLAHPKVKFYIGDVRNKDSLASAIDGADYVFSAAALKQVPSCEFYPLEAVRTNVLGTENVLNVAIAHGVSRVIALSTDKAVYPINAMGMSKALMEKLVVAKSRFLTVSHPVLCCTRYGNVLGSRGSVVPLFVQQIRDGQDLTVTDPNMTRFLMSLDDAVDLVMHAFQHGRQGDIWVQKAPAATIGDLAAALVDLFESKSRVQVIGTRHGEKLYETLLTREEMAHAEDYGRYYRVQADDRDLNYAKYFVKGEGEISQSDDYNSHNTERLSIAAIRDLLRDVPVVRNALADMGQIRTNQKVRE